MAADEESGVQQIEHEMAAAESAYQEVARELAAADASLQRSTAADSGRQGAGARRRPWGIAHAPERGIDSAALL